MKRTLLSTILFALAGLAAESATAQERRPQDVAIPAIPENGFAWEFRLPDSLGIRLSELPEWDDRPVVDDDVSVRSAVPMTSVVVVLREHLPVRTMILRNNTLRLGRYVILSNGQAENWGPYPAGNSDARTLSLPTP